MAEAESIQIGPNGPKIKPMGIGTWQWGDRPLWGYGLGGFTDEDIEQAFDAAIAAGVTFFDTAEIYGTGRSERLLGKFIQAKGQEVVVATKCFPYPWRISRRVLPIALKSSLRRLGLDSVDLYQMHWPFPPLPVEWWMESMAEAVQAGLVKAVGVSNYSASQMQRAHRTLAKHGIPLASNQVQYNLLEREAERSGLLQLCKELGVTLIAYSPLAQGLLTGKYTPQNRPPGIRGRRASPKRLAELVEFNKLLAKMGEKYGGKTPTQMALNWTICKGTLPIPGVKNRAQTEGNLGALGWRLSDEDVARLDEESLRL